jgi:hypothetical protein
MAKSEMLYDETTWNDLGLAEIERKSWDDLSDYQKAAAVYLGMYDRTWDCFQNVSHDIANHLLFAYVSSKMPATALIALSRYSMG